MSGDALFSKKNEQRPIQMRSNPVLRFIYDHSLRYTICKIPLHTELKVFEVKCTNLSDTVHGCDYV